MAHSLRFYGDGTKLYKKGLNDPDNHDDVITQLEPDILQYKVKWALGSIIMNTASGSDGILAELHQVPKDNAVKVLHSICCDMLFCLKKCMKCRKETLRVHLLPRIPLASIHLG